MPRKVIFADMDSRMIPMNDPVVKTIEHAKSLSLQKWHKTRKLYEALLKQTTEPCGFCYWVADLHTGCWDCPVYTKCWELSTQVNAFMEASLKYIEEDLIPYIENFELNREAS